MSKNIQKQVGGNHYENKAIQPIEFIEANNTGTTINIIATTTSISIRVYPYCILFSFMFSNLA